MNFEDFLAVVDGGLQAQLAAAGFERAKAGTWNRRAGDELNAIWVQKHSTNLSCCVNLGVHYTFLPGAGSGSAILSDNIEQPDCEIMLRLTSDASQKDQWWLLSPKTAVEIVELILSRGLTLLGSYGLDAGIGELELKDIESGAMGLLSSLTKGRACLLLARLHERNGNRVKCVEAATLGLTLVGVMAVGPKKAFKDILKRCG